MNPRKKPFIVGIGGTNRPGSSSELAARYALRLAEAKGMETLMLGGTDLDIPMFAAHLPERSLSATRLVQALRRADGIVLASPGYHGSISGLLKNALDYTEDMRGDIRPYFDGRAVACITCAGGWQGTATTLAAMRDIVHALRGWPTPMGVTINTSTAAFRQDGDCCDPRTAAQLVEMMQQVTSFATFMADPCLAMRETA